MAFLNKYFIIKTILLVILLSSVESSPELEKIKMRKYFEQVIKNWTTCEEFVNGTQFDVKAIVDIDWKIFYFWNYLEEKPYIIRFSLATPGIVRRFKVELDKEIKPAVAWSRADLFMETSIDFSGLLIRTKTPGYFRLIPSIAFDYRNIPLSMIALKLVHPYLGLMNCTPRLCYGLVPEDKLPVNDSEIAIAAARIGFRSSVGRSYLQRHEVDYTNARNTTDETNTLQTDGDSKHLEKKND